MIKKTPANNRDIHWKTTDDGYEHIMRTLFDEGIRDLVTAERMIWFYNGWEEDLSEQRERHRKAGIPDENFWHPSKKNSP